MPKFDLSYFGDYDNPQSLVLTGASGPVILAQDWFDFTTIANANLNLFLGIEAKQSVAGGFYPNFGLFITATNADLPAANLFGVILPSLQVSAAAVVGAFKGIDNTVVIPNPATQMQVVLAYVPVATGGGAPATYLMRSALLDVKGV
jgi:hypothetical protein